MSQAAAPTGSQQVRLMQVILAPVISEKSTFLSDKNNQYVFRVASDATKDEIKAAIVLMFSRKEKLEVTSVQVLNVRGKGKRSGRLAGRRSHWKKAYVRLKAGQEINFAEQAEAK